jgi:hypothetical protein
MPDRVELVLRPDGVQVLAPGFPDDPMPWPLLTEGTGLRLHVYTHPEVESQPVKMALRRITLTRTPSSQAPVVATAAPEVEDLPRRTFFAGAPDPAWEPFSFIYDKTFDDLARYQDGWLAAETPAVGSWGRVGLLSDKPLFLLDRRMHATPYRLSFTLDPARTTGFAAILSPNRVADMWGSRAVYASIVRNILGPQAGRHALILDTWNGSWARYLDPDWLAANWDGPLDLDLGDGWARLAIPGAAAIRGPAPVYPFNEFHAVVESVAPGDYDAARMALSAVTGGWVTPPAMDAITRMTLLDDADFDPAAFVDLLGAEMTEFLP